MLAAKYSKEAADMVQMDAVQKRLFQEVADLHDIPEGAYNLRANGQAISRNTTANIDI